MGRPRKINREEVIVLEQYKVRIDDLRPAVGPFPNKAEALAYAKANVKVKEGENRETKIKNSVSPMIKKRLKPMPSLP